MDRPWLDPDRRAFALGLTAAAVGGRLFAQETAGHPPPTSPGDEPRLLTNLLTRMALPVSINGRRSSPFVLDTGAGRTVLSQELATAMALPAGPEVLVHGITAAQTASTVRVARFGIGRRRFTDLVAPVFPRQVLGADGLIGLDVLGRFRLTLNLTTRRIDLAPSGPDVIPLGTADARPSRLGQQGRPARRGRFGQLILASARADGYACDAFVDSGAQYSIGNLALLRAIGGDRPGLQRITVYGVTGQTLAAATGQVGDLRLGRQAMGPTPLLFADLHAFEALDLVERPAILIGADLLSRFREVMLDFGRSRMAFSGLHRTAA